MNVPTETQVSAGGVAYRLHGGQVQIALISVGEPRRWQLPKGLVDPGENAESTAAREAREEAGIVTRIEAPIDTIEYWYQTSRGGHRVRYHKYVHFFLLSYVDGDVADHDDEVNEARWVPIEEAGRMLPFANERRVAEQAAVMIAERSAARSSLAS